MQKHLSLLKDVRGCMTRFDPLTPEIVATQSEAGLPHDELNQVLKGCEMDIEKVVYDGTRAFQNAFYADFELGHYCWIPFQNANLRGTLEVAIHAAKHDDSIELPYGEYVDGSLNVTVDDDDLIWEGVCKCQLDDIPSDVDDLHEVACYA